MSNGRGSSGKEGATSLQQGLEKVDKMIAWGRRLGYTQASINLENWRDARGDRVMPASSFQSEPFLLKHLRLRHRPRFIAGAQRRIAQHTLSIGTTVEMEWTDSVNAPVGSDLWFALGGFTVHSQVRVALVAAARRGRILRFLSWRTDISDVYDWDPGKSTQIPGIGRVTDDEMLALEKAGYGKCFKITSEKAIITDPAVTGDQEM